MRVTIYWKGDTLFGCLHTTNFLMNIPLKQALKKIGWTNWWKIRRIDKCKPFKNDWSKLSKEHLRTLEDLEELLNDLLKQNKEEKEYEEMPYEIYKRYF
jgi:hypothetical protein